MRLVASKKVLRLPDRFGIFGLQLHRPAIAAREGFGIRSITFSNRMLARP
jgi:hypothetical protein